MVVSQEREYDVPLRRIVILGFHKPRIHFSKVKRYAREKTHYFVRFRIRKSSIARCSLSQTINSGSFFQERRHSLWVSGRRKITRTLTLDTRSDFIRKIRKTASGDESGVHRSTLLKSRITKLLRRMGLSGERKLDVSVREFMYKLLLFVAAGKGISLS